MCTERPASVVYPLSLQAASRRYGRATPRQKLYCCHTSRVESSHASCRIVHPRFHANVVPQLCPSNFLTRSSELKVVEWRCCSAVLSSQGSGAWLLTRADYYLPESYGLEGPLRTPHQQTPLSGLASQGVTSTEVSDVVNWLTRGAPASANSAKFEATMSRLS